MTDSCENGTPTTPTLPVVMTEMTRADRQMTEAGTKSQAQMSEISPMLFFSTTNIWENQAGRCTRDGANALNPF